jgi:hypothetical protein
MKAARFYGPGDIRIEQIPEPEPQPGHVKVKVCTVSRHILCFSHSSFCLDCLVGPISFAVTKVLTVEYL